MTREAMAAALASALPERNVKAWDDGGEPISMTTLGSVMAAELRDQGWRLVREGEGD